MKPIIEYQSSHRYLGIFTTLRHVAACRMLPLMLAIVAALLTAGLSRNASANILLYDNYQDNNATGWTTAGGTWAVVVDESYVYKNSNDVGMAVSYRGSSSWSDYSVQARIKPLTWNGTNKSVFLLGRYQSNTDHYYVTLRSSNTIQINKLVNNVVTVIASKTYTISTGTWYTVKLQMIGSSLKMFINGVEQLSTTDTSFTTGKAAVGMASATGEFDNVVVSEIPVGFGAGTTGGSFTNYVDVDTAAELKTAAQSATAQVVRISGTINLSSLSPQVLSVGSNKTFVGVGSAPKIIGTLRCNGVNNVIFQDLTIEGNPSLPAEDGIGIMGASTNIWVDHCTFIDATDGAVDVTNASDYVTISWCRFIGTTKVNLIGGSDSAPADVGKLHVTMHHNWYDTDSFERMPSVRYGRVHIFNSYFNSPGNDSCLNFRLESQVLLENSYFEDINRPWQSTQVTGTTPGKLKISGNTLVNCTNVNSGQGGDTVFTVTYPYNLQSASAAKTSVLAGAGSRL